MDHDHPNRFRVKLVNSTNRSEYVAFKVTPDVIETRNVNYKAIDPIHAPGQMMSYQNTSSRAFNISQIRLISRTEIEAQETVQMLWTLRGWTMPYFGRSSLTPQQQMLREQGFGDDPEFAEFENSINGTELRGAPPAVLLLSAYSSDSDGGAYGKHISRVPVVIQSLSIPYPSDVDYIPAAGSGIPVPTIMTIDMTLTETQSPAAYTSFSLSDYKQGKLAGF